MAKSGGEAKEQAVRISNWRWRLAAIAAVWIASCTGMVWASVTRHYLLQALLGFMAIPVPYSLTMKLVTGKWPPWGRAWRLFTGRERIE